MPLNRVDPLAPRTATQRALTAVGRTALWREVMIHALVPVDRWLLQRTGGRLRTAGSLPTALLTTTGARSGQIRENPILYFHDGDDVILVASSFGRDADPAWAYNLRAHPGCALNGEHYTASEITDAGEHGRIFALAVRVYAGYADYKQRTDAIGRHIPIFRLTPAP